jgi:hypothetical protein
MRSEKQKEASKNNGKKSNGPATPERKEKSSRNAVLHNLTSGRLALLPNEDPREFREFHDHYVHRFQPVDNVELDLIEKMIAASWRERRILAMESALFDIEMDRQNEAVEQEWEEITPAGRQVLVLFGTTDATATANLLLRYKAAARREYASAMRLLRDLQGPRFNRFRGPLPDAHPSHGNTQPLAQEQPQPETSAGPHGQHPPQRQQSAEPVSQTEAASTSQPRWQTMAETLAIPITNCRRPIANTSNNQQTPYLASERANLQNEPEEATLASDNPQQFLRMKAAA